MACFRDQLATIQVVSDVVIMRNISTLHAIWSCPFSKKIWRLTKWRLICNNVSDMFAAIFVWHGKTELKELVFLISHAQCLLEELKKANVLDVVQKVDRNIKWFPPPEGYYKLNTHAVAQNTQGRRGSRAVLGILRGN